MKKKLNCDSFAVSEKTRRYNARVVKNHDVAAAEKAGKFTNRSIINTARRDMHKSRQVARRARPVGNETRRQFKIKGVNAHDIYSYKLVLWTAPNRREDRALRFNAGPYSQRLPECKH
jgi:hypothetical protein